MKALIISLSFVLLFPSLCLSGDSKVYTDADLGQYRSDDTEGIWEYNQEVLQEIDQKEGEVKRRERCEKLLHPETLPKGKGFASALMGIAEGNNQLNAYYDCLAGVKRKVVGQSSPKKHSKTCSSDYDCGIGYACVKEPYNFSGICMQTVNKFGGPTYDLPRLDSVNIKSKGECRFDTDCPIGFHCDFKYKACVQ